MPGHCMRAGKHMRRALHPFSLCTCKLACQTLPMMLFAAARRALNSCLLPALVQLSVLLLPYLHFVLP